MGRYSMKGVQERREIVGSIIEPILQGKRDRKISSDYKRLTPGKDGTIHTVLSPDTASGRLSSNNSPLFEASTNLQNLANKVSRMDELYQMRDVIVPKPGMVLIAGDYKGAEAVLVGAYSEDWAFVEKLLGGEDVHTEHAIYFFGKEIWDAAPPDRRKFMRQLAKILTYASFYAASPPTIQNTLNRDAGTTGVFLSLYEVIDLRAKLLQLHPLEAWWDSVTRLLDEHKGILRNCFGYRRTFYDPDEHSRLKDALNFFPQSTVAWLMNRSLPEIHAKLDKPNVRELLHQIHDEALVQIRPDEVDTYIKTATPIMERSFEIHGRKLYIPVEWKIGHSWGQMKDYKVN